MNLGNKFESKDQYLSSIIEYVASGSRDGRITSFSMSRGYSETVRGPGETLTRVDSKKRLKNFRTIENILKYDGPRLVREKKISMKTLTKAMVNAVNEPMDLVFYVGKDIPDEYLEAIL